MNFYYNNSAFNFSGLRFVSNIFWTKFLKSSRSDKPDLASILDHGGLSQFDLL